MRTKSTLVHLLTGVGLGAVAGVLLGWSTTPHEQYLLSDWPYYVATFGAIGGALCGLAIGILSRNQRPSAFEGIVLGAASGLIIQGPNILPIGRLRRNWFQFVTGGAIGNLWLFFLVGGIIVGALIHTWNLTSKSDASIRRALLQNDKTPIWLALLTLARGAVIGGVAGALVTIAMISIHIATTTDYYENIFLRVQSSYWAVPICALLGATFAGMKLLVRRVVQPAVEDLLRGITAGVLMGLVVEVGFILYEVAHWFEGDSSLVSFIGAVIFATGSTAILTAFITVFAVSVSIISHTLLAKLSGSHTEVDSRN
jgi:hypothetical protein